jgi:hypothetical protein
LSGLVMRTSRPFNREELRRVFFAMHPGLGADEPVAELLKCRRGYSRSSSPNRAFAA